MNFDRAPRRPIVVAGNVGEMDVCLSAREYRQLLHEGDRDTVENLLSGAYTLEPWVRVTQGVDKWELAAGIESRREDDCA